LELLEHRMMSCERYRAGNLPGITGSRAIMK